jgi:hypothetical protein
MGNKLKNHLKGAIIIPIGAAILLVPFSLLIGWNLVTLFLFWFVILPSAIIYLPAKVSKNENQLVESIFGLLIFYALMVFMIYDHYKSDFFLVMMVSCGINLVIVTIITRLVQRKANSASY